MARVEVIPVVQRTNTSNGDVTGVNGANVTITARNTDGTAGSAATLYTDPTGGTTHGSNVIVTDAAGRISRDGAEVWVEPGNYLLAVSGTGITSYSMAWDAVDGLRLPGVPNAAFQGYDTWRQISTTRPAFCIAMLGVLSSDNQNGHINIDVSSNASSTTYPEGFTQAYIGVRQETNASDPEPVIGVAAPCCFFVPAGWSYRYRRETIGVFGTPTFSIGNDGATWEFLL